MLLNSLLTPLLAMTVAATNLSIKTASQQKHAAKIIADKLLTYYTTKTGLLLPPYYAWESAGMWSSMIHYTVFTRDPSFLSNITTSLATQAGPTMDFMGPDTPGNDDQLWWGLAAMSAAEARFPMPPEFNISAWEKLARNVFDQVIARWDNTTCNGGLHWQISDSASGYSYKNSITNSLALQLAVRLANFTHSKRNYYLSWAEKIWTWMLSVNLIDKTTYVVYDGTDSENNCSDLNHDLWSYNVAVPMYAVSHQTAWEAHLQGFLNATKTHFTNSSVLVEKCEADGSCDADQLSFKAYLAGSLAEVAVRVPWTREEIIPILRASAEGALGSCNGGGADGCGMQWTTSEFDGKTGVGQQMSALEIVLGVGLVEKAVARERKAAGRESKHVGHETHW